MGSVKKMAGLLKKKKCREKGEKPCRLGTRSGSLGGAGWRGCTGSWTVVVGWLW